MAGGPGSRAYRGRLQRAQRGFRVGTYNTLTVPAVIVEPAANSLEDALH